jgi:NHLM bacteriocin system ABC transporter ATP-binding protein
MRAGSGPLELSGNRRLLLDDPSSVWVVAAGEVDVFAVSTRDGAPFGARTHLCHLQPGAGVFGSTPIGGVALMVVGRPGSRLERPGPSEHRELLEGWVHALSAAIADPPPRDLTELSADQSCDVEAGQAFRLDRGLAWIQVVEGRLELGDIPAASIGPDDGPFPVSSSLWLRARGTSRIVPASGPDSLDAVSLGAESLDAFFRVFGAVLVARLDALGNARTHRALARSEANAAAVDTGLRTLTEFFADGTEAGEAVAKRAAVADPLLAACREVGRALGVPVESPPASDAAARDRLAAIARASRVRTRQVTLESDWWRSDAGPLLGFRRLPAGAQSTPADEVAEQSRPVALVRTGRRYRLMDPTSGDRLVVTAEVAASLSPVAYTMYRPFPERTLGVRDLLRFGLRGSGADLWTVLLTGLLGGLLALVVPIATSLLFDRFIPAADAGGVAQVAFALVASAFAIAAFQLTRALAVARLGARMDLSLEAAIWDRLLDLPAPFFREYSSGDLALRATGISTIRRVLSGVVTTAVLGAAFSSFSFVLLFVYDARLALVASVLLVVAMVVGVVAVAVQMRDHQRSDEVRGRQAGLELEMLNGVSKLRVAGAEARAFGVWARLVPGAAPRRAQLAAMRVNVVYAALPLAALLVIFPIAGLRGDSDLTAGTFLAFNTALTQVITAVIALGTSLSAVAQIVPLYQRASPILQTLPEVEEGRTDPGELAGDVEVSNVTFRYVADGRPVLDQVSFRARPGEFVALVGPSGSGKSTILRLLLGFETAESGSIYLDAQDLASLDFRAVRRQMGVVLQSGRLASGSIFDNIVGSSPFTMEEAWEAARSAGFDADVRQMPMGMHTMVMEGGAGLSGGQRQRLLIARAIIGKPRILIFDEATSALDNRTQAVVSESLERLQATRIVIAHRLSTVIKADQIHVVEAGRIVESGTYSDLMQRKGPFAALAARQLA